MGAAKFAIIDECFKDVTDLSQFACVEFGSEHFGKGEGSTRYLSRWCRSRGVEFHTVDFDPTVSAHARTITPNTWCMKGETFLSNSPTQKKVVFAYLDDFDWIYPLIAQKPKLHLQVKRYSDIDGTIMNNSNSQLSHLEQARLLLPLLHERSFVLFDDTWRYESGAYDGKGGTAVPFLLSSSFRIVSEKIAPDDQGDTFDGWVLLSRG